MNARDLLRPALVAARTAAQAEALATELDAVAAELRARAGAQRRDQSRPAATRVVASGTGRGGRPGAQTVYLIEANAGDGRHADILRLRIGRGVYDAFARQRTDPALPLRLAVQLVGDRLYLSEDASGYAVTVTAGGCWMTVSGARDVLDQLTIGQRYPAAVQGSSIVAAID